MRLDGLDLDLLNLVLEEPRAGVREYARVLGVARGTAASRLARLEREGVITGDLLCRVAARNNAHLEAIVQGLLALPGVVRTRTEVALNQRVAYRTLPLVRQVRGTRPRAGPGA